RTTALDTYRPPSCAAGNPFPEPRPVPSRRAFRGSGWAAKADHFRDPRDPDIVGMGCRPASASPHAARRTLHGRGPRAERCATRLRGLAAPGCDNGGMDVLLANPRGFCAGVDRAIEIVD